MEANASMLQLYKILDLLEQFCRKKNQNISLIKLANALNLSSGELDLLIEVIFRFQSIFKNFPQKQILSKIWRKGECYLTLTNKNGNSFSTEIRVTKEDLHLLSDVAYYFCHVNIGQGFSIKFVPTDLLKKIKLLQKKHPYFFEYRGNGLVYPSELALKLGKILETYNRANRSIITVSCGEYIVKII